MAKIRSIQKIAEKWATVTPQRATDYQEGVKDPKKDWAEEAVKADPIYKEAVIKAANEGRYASGVSKAGTKRWQERTLTKGPARFSEGVMIARPDYEKNFAPYRDIIEKTELPPRGPRGDVKNIQRVQAIAMALHKAKLEMMK
ncbi:MAG: hypothetical protein DRH57_04870 [Candidatus Cloacimonadota bacterium]|nr:MAG: hypothetical protein DRH57_04870 [Candidatus Cloacimonadota bacterium]